MRARHSLLLGTFLLLGTVVLAQSERPNFTGKWHLDKSKSHLSPDSEDVTWNIQQDEENIQITEEGTANGKPFKADLKCGTLGKECVMNDRDHKAKVSAYYNGPALIMMKTDGRKEAAVTKQKITLLPDGNAMEVEIMYIVPPKDVEKLVFTKSE